MKPFLRRLTALAAVSLCTLASPARATRAAEARKPNIIVILADDLGYGSLGCYGGARLQTPACDRLAREGRRFTNAYAPGSVCSPSRYALMTGRYMWRTSISDGIGLGADAPLHIETNRVTLGSLARSQGYRTAAIGKWHLGLGLAAKTDWNAPLTPGPLQVGFDYFFGLAANVNNRPDAYIESDQLLNRKPGQLVTIEGKGKDQKTVGITPVRAPDEVMGRLTAKAVQWIEDQHDQPFFLYYAPNAVHEPVTPAGRFAGSPFGKYGDFIHELDWSVGQILAALEKHQLLDNTLIIFTSDNGGALNIHLEESMVALKAGLAINGPLRDGKGSVWEGGFREPFIVRWPGRVPAGTVCDDLVSLSDVLATLAGILQAPLPAGHAEDSRDVSASWLGTVHGQPPRESIVLQAADAGEYAVRQGSWKLIERENPPPFQTTAKAIRERTETRRKHWPRHDQLFNLVADVAETNDVAAAHPDLVARLRQVLAEARAQNAVRPAACAQSIWFGPRADRERTSGFMNLFQMEQWFDAYVAATGEPLAFFRLDMQWQGPWREQMPALVDLLRRKGIPLQVIYNGSGQAASDEAWIAQALAHAREFESGGWPLPSGVAIQCWTPKPARLLPETDPQTLTSLINQYVRQHEKKP